MILNRGMPCANPKKFHKTTLEFSYSSTIHPKGKPHPGKFNKKNGFLLSLVLWYVLPLLIQPSGRLLPFPGPMWWLSSPVLQLTHYFESFQCFPWGLLPYSGWVAAPSFQDQLSIPFLFELKRIPLRHSVLIYAILSGTTNERFLLR